MNLPQIKNNGTYKCYFRPGCYEKSEQQKSQSNKTYTLKISPRANKIDVKNALKKFYDTDVVSVRVMWTLPKTRRYGRNQIMEKRHRFKKALVTLAPKSKSLDLTSFKAA